MSRRNVIITDPQTTSLKDEEKENNIIEEQKTHEIRELNTVPCSKLHNVNLKKIKSFRMMRQNYKLENQKQTFISSVSQMLNHMNITENTLNIELLIEICNISHEFFIYGNSKDRERCKLESVQELMLPYFMDNIQILDTVLTSIQHKIRKSNCLKRFLRRAKNFFF